MPQQLEDLAGQALTNLSRIRETRKLLQGPPDEWSLAAYRG